MSILQKFISFEVLFTIISGSAFIFFMDLYGRHNNTLHLITAIISTIIFLIFIYRMALKKYDPVVVNLCAKVFPMIVLTILSIFILKRKWNFYTILGLLLIFIGAILVST
jgi:uncharacterized membrane protein